ncbi:MAG: ABC transporter permease, partial [Blautia sp.]|nr:ABC transporter permease [Blautia sp.]
MRELTAEHQKQKRRRIWLIPLGFLVILYLWISVSRNSFYADDLAMGYSFLLYQLPLLNVVLVPVMTAVIASRLCDMEIKGNTLKLLYTLQKREKFYDWK